MATTICVLGAYGEFIGSYLALECLKRSNVITKILVRPNYLDFPHKKTIVDDLVSKGAQIVYGDAFDVESLTLAFSGVDIVISSLGGWGDLISCHQNVYTACKATGVKRVVPAQFGFDILALPEEVMDNYMKTKRRWNLDGIESGIPYTIVSHGAFSEWFLTMPNHPFIHHDTRTVDYCETPDTDGIITTTLADTARLTVDAVLDPEMINKRISLYGAKISIQTMADILSRVTGKSYTPHLVSTYESLEADKHSGIEPSKEKAFNDYIASNIAKGSFIAGFHEPFLVDTETRYGWKIESFEDAAFRLLPSFLASQGF